MYLLSFDDLVIPGLKKSTNDSPQPEGFMTKERDIEASAGSSKRASTVGLGA